MTSLAQVFGDRAGGRRSRLNSGTRPILLNAVVNLAVRSAPLKLGRLMIALSFISTTCLVGSFDSLQAATAQRCPSIPAPVITIPSSRRYVQSDPHRATVDPAAVAQRQEKLTPVFRFLSVVAHLSDDVFRGDSDKMRCLTGTLDSWAKADALLGPTRDMQPGYDRAWALAGLSLAILKGKRVGLRPTDDLRRWLKQLATQVRTFADGHNLRNNLGAWSALAVGASSQITANESDWQWAVAYHKMLLREVGSDGSLPRELNRGKRALGYHVFAAIPLIALQQLRECRKDADESSKNSLTRLLNLLKSSNKEEIIRIKSGGFEQDSPNNLLWIDVLQTGQGQPIRTSRMGGDAKNLHDTIKCAPSSQN